MGAQQARGVTGQRPRWHSYLLLSRVSNLPTVWTNVLAGLVVSGGALQASRFLWLALAVSLLYAAGMFLNDAFDAAFDSIARPERPVPSGDVRTAEVFVLGGWLLCAGVVVVAWISRAALPWALALGAAIVYYDFRHKRDSLSPVVMGLCRGLVYWLAAAAANGFSRAVLIAGLIAWGYVTALSLASRRPGARSVAVIPMLIAGISVVDALIILPFAPSLAPLALMGAAVTLAAQRFVPGD